MTVKAAKTFFAAVAAAMLAAVAFADAARVAVFVDRGARNIGAFRWIEIVSLAQDAEFLPVDGEAIRAGALDRADVLVVPGGWSGEEAQMLGAEGRDKVRAFIWNGGGYIGTCAGCCLLMESAPHHKDMLGVIPFKFGKACGGHADMLVNFNSRAEALAGIKKKTRRIRYSQGPVPLPSLPVDGAEMEVVATYASDVNQSDKARTSFAGQAAAVAGTYGKGKVFALAVHPEYDVDDHDIIAGAFRYVCGRELKWEYPQRKRGMPVAGFVCDDSFGVETAKAIAAMLEKGECDIVPINKDAVAEGILHHLDKVVVPETAGSAPLEKIYGAALLDAWKSGETRAKETVAAQDGSRKAKVAVYTDKGGCNYSIVQMLALDGRFDVEFLDAEDVRAGRLEGFDMLLQPGGSCREQRAALGDGGCEAIERYVRGGGSYYGLCAGAFLATQTARKEPEYKRIGLVPFKDDAPGRYRGWGEVRIALTDAGKKFFPGSPAKWTTLYWGGPALVAGDEVEGADVEILGTYNGWLINGCSSKPVKEMRGKGAFAAGRVGEGKIFLSCPHPEKSEATLGRVADAVEFLAGVRPQAVAARNRKPGAETILFIHDRDKKTARFWFDSLLADENLDVRCDSRLDMNLLPHIDTVIVAEAKLKEKSKPLERFAQRGGRVLTLEEAKKEYAK